MIKKVFTTILNVISVAAIAVAIVALLCVVLTPSGETPNIMGYSMLRVLTGSMTPTIETNSLIVVKRVDPSEIQVGDIITFYSSDPVLEGAANTHRVTKIEETDTGYAFTTKGDANVLEDTYPALSENVVGKVVWWSLALGKAVALAVNPIVFLVAIVLPLASMVAYNLFHVVRATRQVLQQEEKLAIEKALQDAGLQPKTEAPVSDSAGAEHAPPADAAAAEAPMLHAEDSPDPAAEPSVLRAEKLTEPAAENESDTIPQNPDK